MEDQKDPEILENEICEILQKILEKIPDRFSKKFENFSVEKFNEILIFEILNFKINFSGNFFLTVIPKNNFSSWEFFSKFAKNEKNNFICEKILAAAKELENFVENSSDEILQKCVDETAYCVFYEI